MNDVTRAFAILAILFSVGSASGVTIYVDDDALNDPGPGDPLVSDPNETGALDHPYDAIQEAIDVAMAGDEVVLVDGTYTGVGNKDLDLGGKAITVRSASGDPAACVIDCEGNGRGFYFHNAEAIDSVINGLTIAGGNNTYGGAIRCSAASPTLERCIFSGNSGVQGGALYLDTGSNPTVMRCVFSHNSSILFAGAIYNLTNSSPSLENCTFVGNTTASTGGALYNSGSHPTLTNCTFSGNTASYGSAICNSSSSPTLTNCVLWGDTGDELYNDSSSNPVVTYSCIEGGAGQAWFGAGCVDVDPQYTALDDQHLKSGSPCIDTGTNTPPGGLPAVDLEGGPRLVDGDGNSLAVVDMGAYEAPALDPNIPIIAISSNAFAFSYDEGLDEPAEQVLTIFNRNSGTLNWEITGQPEWLTVAPMSGTSSGEANPVTLTADPSGLSAGTYVAVLMVNAAFAPNSPVEVNVVFEINDSRLVPYEYATIQAAIDSAASGNRVVIADGTYSGTGNVNLVFSGKAITVRSASGDPARCVIDCEGTSSGFYFQNNEGADSILAGLSIINGNAGYGGGIYCYLTSPTIRECVISRSFADYGGGLYCVNSSPNLNNCVIGDNFAGVLGGGICCYDSNPSLSGCVIAGNYAGEYGGGVSCSGGGPILANCLITANVSLDAGGIVSFNDSHLRLTNCSLIDNTAIRYAGGIYFYDGDPTLTNCVLWGNEPESALVMSGQPNLIHCDVEGGWTGIGQGNIENAPLFVDPDGADNNPHTWRDNDYRVRRGSPCTDAGTNAPPYGLPETDLDGAPRVLDGDSDSLAVVDMGAYERPEIVSSYITTDPSSVRFTYRPDDPNSAEQCVTIQNSGDGTLNWAISGQPSWLSVSPVTGSSTGNSIPVTLSVDPNGLTVGVYTCNLSISDPAAQNSPYQLLVTLYINRVIHVPADYPTIQAAIDAAIVGDVVELADGTYTGAGNKNLDYQGKALTVRSASGNPASCVIDCEGSGSGFNFHNYEGGDAIVEGLTVTQGYTSHGGAVICNRASPTIRGCVLSNSSAMYGGGVYCLFGHPNVINCVIGGNTASEVGGGMYALTGRPTLTNCLIVGNFSTSEGGGVQCEYSANAMMTNCTVTGNTTSGARGGIYLYYSDPILTNCIFRGNTPPYVLGGAGSQPSVNYCYVERGVLGGVGNVAFVDVLFADPDGADDNPDTWSDNDYRLEPNSPCVDAGTNIFPGGFMAVDLDGYPRIADGDSDSLAVVDMGVYELSEVAILVQPNTIRFTNVAGDPNPADQVVMIRNHGFGTLHWSLSEDSDWLTVFPTSGTVTSEGENITLSVDTSSLQIGSYVATLSVSDPDAVNSPVQIPVHLNVVPPAPEIVVEPNAIAFEAFIGVPQVPEQTLAIWNSGTGVLDWEVAGQGDWLNADPNRGDSIGERDIVTLFVDPNGLAAGEYARTLTIRHQADPNVSVAVPVSLMVIDPFVVPTEYPTIQAAIDAANPGETIAIVAGVYTGVGNKDLDYHGKAITVRSASGDPNSVIIDCEGEGRGFYFHSGEGADSILKGVTIANGLVSGYGGGIECDNSSPSFMDCEFRDNHGYYGGGASTRNGSAAFFLRCRFVRNVGGGSYSVYGSPTFKECLLIENQIGGGAAAIFGWESHITVSDSRFHRNMAFDGGRWYLVAGIGVRSNSSLTLDRSIFTENATNGYSAVISAEESDLVIRNCIVRDNPTGGVRVWGGTTEIVNCSIVGNLGAGVYFSNATESTTITNSVIWNNTQQVTANSSSLVVAYSCIQGGYSGEGNTQANPGFASSDLYLRGDSACIDAGVDPNTVVTGDYTGTVRPLDGDMNGVAQYDVGAYEYDPNKPLIAIDTNLVQMMTLEGDPNILIRSVFIENAGAGQLDWEITGESAWLSVTPKNGASTSDVDEVVLTVDPNGLPNGLHVAELIVTDPRATVSSTVLTVELSVRSLTPLLVPSEYSTIQAAIDAAQDGEIVEIADGIYTGSGNKNLNFNGKSITVRGASGVPENCVIDCQGNGRGIFFNSETEDAIVESLSIHNGYASSDPVDFSPGGYGGGAISSTLASPTIRNCIFRNNSKHSLWASGVYANRSPLTLIECKFIGNQRAFDAIDSSATLIGCQFIDNSDNYVGGVSLSNSDTLLSNCIFIGNSGGTVAASYVDYFSDALFTNCTFIGNTATDADGVAIYSGSNSSVTLNNCVMWWNLPAQTYGDSSSSLSIHNSNLQPDWDNWSSDIIYPQLASSGHLTAASISCIDMGDVAWLPDDLYDLDEDGDTAEPLPWDIDGEMRIVDCGFDDDPNATVDIGADEFIDTDLDGLPDWWEAKYFGDALAADPNADGDNDGLINLDEYEDFSSDPNATPIYVDKANDGDPNADGSLGNPFPAIQLALDAASDGDTVILLNSVDNYYTGAGNSELDFHGRRIVLRAAGNITLSTERGMPAVLVDSVRGAGSAMIGFTFVSDAVESGSGFDLSSYSLFFRDCTFLINDDDPNNPYGHSLKLSEGYIALGGIQLGKAEDPNAPGLVGQGSAEIERAWVHLDGDVSLVNSNLELLSVALFPNDLQSPQSTIDLDAGSTLFVTGNETYAEPTVMYANVSGQGDLIVDERQTLHVRGKATIDMTPDDYPSVCGEIPAEAGNIIVGPFGTLECLDECRIMDAIVYLTGDDDLGNVTEITNSQLILDEKIPGYSGYLKIGKNAFIQCNRIDSYGDRYLSFDPDPADPNRPTFQDNKIFVTMTQGLGADQARPLEIRNQDMDNTVGDGASGAYQLASSTGDPNGLGFVDPWALEELTILAGAEVVLTNRAGFEFNADSPYPDALYVKKLVLHEGATLNTGLQRMYYHSLVGENGQVLTRDPNAPYLPLANGSRIVDMPLLGFSVTTIHLDDDPNTPGIDESQQEFEYRIGRRVYDELGTTVDPNDPNCVGGDVTLRDPNWIVGSVLEMRTAAEGCLPATSVAAKGQFSRAGSETITVDFDYLWRGPGELIVYASSYPRVSACPNEGTFEDCHVEIGRMTPPADGRPGSVGDMRFATFAVTFPADLLDFSRGVYVELELFDAPNHLGEAMLWIDRWDPQVRCNQVTNTCLDFTRNNAVGDDDFLVLIAEAGSAASTEKGCLDVPFSTNSYVDLGDLLAVEALLSADPAPQNYCGPPSPGSSLGESVDSEQLFATDLVIAGKSSLLSDGLYGLSAADQTPLAAISQSPRDEVSPVRTATLNPPLRPASAGPARGNSRLYKDHQGVVYQLHATQGLIRLDTAEREIAPFSDTFNDQAVYVGVQSDTGDPWGYDLYGYPQGLPLLDVAFDPVDPDVVYVAPVVVQSTSYCQAYGGPCPYYKAAAQLTRQGDGSYRVSMVYGFEPSLDPCGNASPPSASACYIQGQSEIEVDSNGTVLVLSAMGHTANNDWLMVYDADSGAEQARIALTDLDANLANPSTLVASRYMPGQVYLTSQLDQDPDDTQTTLYRCTLNPSAPSNPLVITDAIQVQCGDVLPPDDGYGYLLLTTEVLENPGDGSLRLLGLAMARSEPDLSTDDPRYGQLFCDGCPLESQPWLAAVPAGSSGPANATLISGSVPLGEELVLPLSAVQFVAGDISGDDLIDGEDLDTFAACMAGPDVSSTCDAIIRRRANKDFDPDVDVRDFAMLQRIVSQ